MNKNIRKNNARKDNRFNIHKINKKKQNRTQQNKTKTKTKNINALKYIITLFLQSFPFFKLPIH